MSDLIFVTNTSEQVAHANKTKTMYEFEELKPAYVSCK